MNTAISDRLIDSTVKPTSRAPRSAASQGVMPSSMWRVVFSSTTTASSTTKPVAIVSAISVKLLTEKPARYMTPKVPTSETGTATIGISVARPLRRKTNTTRITSTTAITSARPVSRSEARIVTVRSIATFTSIALGNRRAQQRQQILHAVDRVDDVRVGLAVDDHRNRGPAVRHPGVAQVLHRVDDLGDRGQRDRRAAAPRDDQRQVLGSGLRLVVGEDLPVAVAVLDRPLGLVRVRRRERRAHVLEADAVLEERIRVELDAHRGQRTAAHAHLPDALDLRELLRHDRRRGVVHLPLRHRVRRERQDHDRRVGRVHLAVRRIAG